MSTPTLVFIAYIVYMTFTFIGVPFIMFILLWCDDSIEEDKEKRKKNEDNHKR